MKERKVSTSQYPIGRVHGVSYLYFTDEGLQNTYV
jgi:hypothetical protein